MGSRLRCGAVRDREPVQHLPGLIPLLENGLGGVPEPATDAVCYHDWAKNRSLDASNRGGNRESGADSMRSDLLGTSDGAMRDEGHHSGLRTWVSGGGCCWKDQDRFLTAVLSSPTSPPD